MYISNNAIILPVCNIRVEICLYIIIALPRLILFSIPSSLFLTWCSYIKYLSKLKLQCSRSVCWLVWGGGGGGARHWHVFISHSCWKQKKRPFFVHSVLHSLTRFCTVFGVSFLRFWCWFVPYIWNQIQYSVCYTSLHDVCLSIRLRIRTLLSGWAHVHIGPLLDCGSVNAHRGLWLPDQVRRSKGSTQSKFSLVWFSDLTRLSECVYFLHWCEWWCVFRGDHVTPAGIRKF